MSRLAIIIPAYNEELTIKATLVDYFNYFPDAYFCVIDNNSSDKTHFLAKETFREYSIKGSLLQEPRQGKGYAIRTGLTETDADYYIMTDADTTYKASEAVRLFTILKTTKADIVTGDRHRSGAYKKENKRIFHNFGNSLVRYLICFLFRTNLHDILTGLRVFNKKFAKNFPIMSKGFELETEMTLHILDKRFYIVEEPIDYIDRPEGSLSKLNTFRDGFRLLFQIFQIFRYYKPLIFFSIFSLVLLVLGLIPGVIVINEYYTTGYIFRFPSAILAAGLVISSGTSFCIGLVLDNLARLNRENFELQIIKFSQNT